MEEKLFFLLFKIQHIISVSYNFVKLIRLMTHVKGDCFIYSCIFGMSIGG